MSGATANQDSYFVKENLAGFSGTTFLGVCDGHGAAGHHVSQHISGKLITYMESMLRDYLSERTQSVNPDESFRKLV